MSTLCTFLPNHVTTKSKLSCNHVHQTWPLDTSHIHLWRADDGGVLTRTTHHTTPQRDSQMGASSGRICHHNGNVSVYWCTVCARVLLCLQVFWGCLWARKYMCGATAVLTTSRKGVGVGDALWQVCDACYCDGSGNQRAPRLSETDNPDRRSLAWPLA